MIQQWLNWRTALTLFAVCIVTGTIFYSNYLSKKIGAEEKQKVETWVEAQKTILTATEQTDLNLAIRISTGNDDIPIIETNEKDSITNNYVNLDSAKVSADKSYLLQKLQEFKSVHPPIILPIPEKPNAENRYYYGESRLQKEVRYYPIVQLIIIGLFIIITVIAQRSRYQNTQNQVWAGLAKETAHQLGTPVTSLEGWVEVLRDIPGNEKLIGEIEKDVNRLKLISDRFGKIGSIPKLEERNLVEQITNMIDYIKKRASGKVQFTFNTNGETNIPAMVSPPLFDWVIENLLKNALDAMEGKGKIDVTVKDEVASVVIDVKDNGKGISKQNIAKVFKPGFTTKKRGWGLGLTLTQRIVEQYHKGKIFVKHSEIGKGTTFRIVLNK
ncbi:HAMP domain-containing sensor histidine kinase [Segetibacter sp.]|jgi:signal transduction histidine kinase|uniref:sensor histidine kinase n=1 Tax=Segetibacter sp. TaxID=2231182 RepID=UPI002602455D|nr:HAMP domain-containing sensor histidine kinase [Segetibacter sp.]MCW3080294.1 histidine kinase [Segetibacter sp.]